MMLGELIDLLESLPAEKVCEHAFDQPHSWRGLYMELAFEPAENRTVGEMLADVKSADGATYYGYKGGEFTMNRSTDIHLEHYGTAEDLLPEYGLRWMLGL